MSPREDLAERPTGPRIAEKYELVRLLGEGGMGSVYEARHVITGKRVAVKRMSAAFAADPTAVKRFLREARVATAIEHPNVVEIFDFGAADGAPYMVMAFLEGMALSEHMAREGKLSAQAAFTLLAPILEALDAAHRIGIVHRDIKPDNIFLARTHTGELVPKLLDFGISKSRDQDDFKLTRTGMVMGTPYYMSPEQARGESEVDARADLYAMGVILYECLTGTLPFLADNYNALLLAIVTKAPPSLAEARPDLPHSVVESVERAMAKRREDRYGSTLGLRNALARSLGEVERTTVAPLHLAATAEGTSVVDPLAQSGVGPARSRGSEVFAPRGEVGADLGTKRRRGANVMVAVSVALALALTMSVIVMRSAPPRTTDREAIADVPAVPSRPRDDDTATQPTQLGTGSSRIARARLCSAQGLDRCVTDLLLGQAQSEEELALLIDTLVRLDEASVAREQARRYRALYPRGSRYAELARLANDAAPSTSSRPAATTERPSALPLTASPPTPNTPAPTTRDDRSDGRRAGELDESEF